MADKPVTWGTKADHLKGLRRQAEYTLACIVDVEGMADLEQEAGRLRTQIEGYQAQTDKAKQTAATAEAQQRAAETSLANAVSQAEAETSTLNARLIGLAQEVRAGEAEATRAATARTEKAQTEHARLVEGHNKEIAALERTKAKLEADIRALRQSVGALPV